MKRFVGGISFFTAIIKNIHQLLGSNSHLSISVDFPPSTHGSPPSSSPLSENTAFIQAHMSLVVIWPISTVCTNGGPFNARAWIITRFSRESVFPSRTRERKGSKLDLMMEMPAGDEAVGKKGACSLDSG